MISLHSSSYNVLNRNEEFRETIMKLHFRGAEISRLPELQVAPKIQELILVFEQKRSRYRQEESAKKK